MKEKIMCPVSGKQNGYNIKMPVSRRMLTPDCKTSQITLL